MTREEIEQHMANDGWFYADLFMVESRKVFQIDDIDFSKGVFYKKKYPKNLLPNGTYMYLTLDSFREATPEEIERYVK